MEGSSFNLRRANTQHHYVLGIVLCVHVFAQLILIALGEVAFYCYPHFTYVEAEVQGG